MFKLTPSLQEVGRMAEQTLMRTIIQAVVATVTSSSSQTDSNVAADGKVTPIEGGSAFRVTYGTEDCLPDEPNSLKATLRLNTARLSTTLHF